MNAKHGILAALLVCMATGTASAWNDPAHMTIAELAWRSLSAKQRGEVSDLLKQHPHYAELLAAAAPTGVNTNEWVFLKASTWPDMVRPARTGPPKPESVTAYNHGNWHYVNKPFVASADKATINPADHRPDATNAVERLGVVERELMSAAPASNKAVALCWYLHLAGDLHQPLHCANWYSAAFPNGDSGGNEEAIKPGAGILKLHAYWDQLPQEGTNYAFIATQADSIANDPALSKPSLTELATNKTYDSWADESLVTAAKFAYLDGQVRFARYYDGITPAEVPDLNPGYEADARTIARRRIALAAFRLGNKLQLLF